VPFTDTDLLLRMRRGDEAAARALWSTHAGRLTAYAQAILARSDPASAPDIVQQVFMAALRVTRAEARAIRDVPAWFLRLTRNLALNRVRSLRRERARLAGAPDGARSTHSLSGTPESRVDLLALIEALPRPLREVVILKHAGGLTFDQMAAALSTNRNTLAARYQKALTLLRENAEPDRAPSPTEEVAHARH
jgi:RNA polymerase sigma-70 factor (ECF subfamily)